MTPDRIAELLSEDINFNNGLSEAAFMSGQAQTLLSKPSVVAWIRKHGIPEYNPEDIKHLGEGGIGHAFRYGDKVMKITTDKDEALLVQRAARIKHENLTTYHGSVQIGTIVDKFGKSRTIYLIILDYVDLDNVPQELKDAADFVGGYLDVEQAQPPYDVNVVDEIMKYNEIDDKKIRQYIVDLFNILNSLYNKGLDYRDVGATNISISNGQIKLFDLGLSKFKV